MRCRLQELSTGVLLSLALGVLTVPGYAQEPAAEKPAAEKPAAEKDVETLVSEAQAAVEGSDYQEALRLAEQALKTAPKNLQALRVKTISAYNLGRRAARTDEEEANRLHREAAAAARQVLQSKEKPAKEKPAEEKPAEEKPAEEKPAEEDELLGEQQYMAIFYYGAGALAQAGEKEQAVESLKLAAENGFDYLELLESNEDLAPLRELESYKKFVADLEKQVAQQAKVDAVTLLKENKPFDFSFSLPSVQGKTVSLKDYKGQVAIVDFWGTWCPPCRKEIPHFVELQKQYHDKGLRIVGINYEGSELSEDEARAKIETAIEEFDIPYSCLLGDEETKDQVPGFRGYPTTLFIDREGKVRAMTIGYRPYVELEAIIELLLAEGSAADSPKDDADVDADVTPPSTTPATPDTDEPADPADSDKQ